tara:strand:- start:168 stop:413 length:246 start_codon:yes stop_codon:yes gene_type:complete
MDSFDYDKMSLGILILIFIYLVYSYINHDNETFFKNEPESKKETFYEQSTFKKLESEPDTIVYEGKVYHKNNEGKYVLKTE